MNRTLLRVAIFIIILGSVVFLIPNKFVTPVVPSTSDSEQPQVNISSNGARLLSPSPTLQESASDELQILVRRAGDALPRRGQAQGEGDQDSHHAPQSVMMAAERIGQLVEHIELHPGRKPQAVEFFVECAGADQVLASVRALCYHELETIARDTGLSLDEDRFSRIPSSIRELSDALGE